MTHTLAFVPKNSSNFSNSARGYKEKYYLCLQTFDLVVSWDIAATAKYTGGLQAWSFSKVNFSSICPQMLKKCEFTSDSREDFTLQCRQALSNSSELQALWGHKAEPCRRGLLNTVTGHIRLTPSPQGIHARKPILQQLATKGLCKQNHKFYGYALFLPFTPSVNCKIYRWNIVRLRFLGSVCLFVCFSNFF